MWEYPFNKSTCAVICFGLPIIAMGIIGAAVKVQNKKYGFDGERTAKVVSM